MSKTSESIATQSTELSKSKFKLDNELKELEKFPDIFDATALEKELDSINEEISVLGKRIENNVYELVENDLAKNDLVSVLLADGFINIDGLTLVNDLELGKIGKFLGYKHYMMQPCYNWVSIYFYDDEGVFNFED
jgi:hypothetical protein